MVSLIKSHDFLRYQIHHVHSGDPITCLFSLLVYYTFKGIDSLLHIALQPNV